MTKHRDLDLPPSPDELREIRERLAVLLRSLEESRDALYRAREVVRAVAEQLRELHTDHDEPLDPRRAGVDVIEALRISRAGDTAYGIHHVATLAAESYARAAAPILSSLEYTAAAALVRAFVDTIGVSVLEWEADLETDDETPADPFA